MNRFRIFGIVLILGTVAGWSQTYWYEAYEAEVGRVTTAIRILRTHPEKRDRAMALFTEAERGLTKIVQNQDKRLRGIDLSSTTIEVRVPGDRYVDYVPFFYLGMAKWGYGSEREAVEEFKKSWTQELAIVGDSEELERIWRSRMKGRWPNRLLSPEDIEKILRSVE